MLYVYESCLGNVYTSKYDLDLQELYCETCGDLDTFIGTVKNESEIDKLVEQYNTDLYG